jgi:hypothetical protein
MTCLSGERFRRWGNLGNHPASGVRKPKANGRRPEMKKPTTLQAHQLEPFAHFLEEHPGFSPYLVGEDALVGAFQVGGSYLRIDEMARLITARPHFEEDRQTVPLSVPVWTTAGGNDGQDERCGRGCV